MVIKFGEAFISNESKAHIDDCLDNNYVTMGPKTKLLEEAWAKKFGYKAVRAVSSGTAACIAALLALYDLQGAEPGDEVICPGLSFIATANSIRAAGLTPVFCDVKMDMMIDENMLNGLLTDKTIAVMPVTLMGKPPKMDVIRKFADDNKLTVIVDNCEGHGCKYQGKYMSEWGDIVVYSCYAAHILFGGELGLVGCRTQEIGDLIESVRSHGRKPGSLYFSHDRFGLNLKPTDIHASIALGNLKYFDDIMRKRKNNQEMLQLIGYEDYFWYVEEDSGDYNSPHAFSLIIKPNTKATIEGLQRALTDADIEWKRNFGSMPDHKCFEYLGKKGFCPTATYIGNNGLHVGVHDKLSRNDVEKITQTIVNYVESL